MISGLALMTGVLWMFQAAGEENKADLRAVLEARAEENGNFRADVQVVSSRGTERAQIVETRRLFRDWVEKNQPELRDQLPDRQRFEAGLNSDLKPLTVTRRLRYFAEASGRIRIEELSIPAGASAGKSDGAAAEVDSVRVFTGTAWKAYHESVDRHTGERSGGLSIYDTDSSNDSWHELARGAGDALHYLFSEGSLKFDFSRRAAAVRVLDWKEWLQNLPAVSHEESTVPPGGTEPKPSLVFETKPFRDTGKGLYRLQVWFAPEHGYALSALTASDLQPAGGSKWDFLPNHVVEWSDPAELEGGRTVYQKCHIRFYEHLSTITEGLPLKEWPQQAYDFLNYDYTLSNIEVGKPLDVALFDVQPVAGTNVIDEPKGFLYVVGNAGEELHKTAMSERDRRPPGDKQPSSAVTWRLVLTIANVVALLALAVYWLFLRKRRVEQKP